MKIASWCTRTAPAISALLFIALSSCVLFLWITYISEEIQSGEAYGFVIGQSKKDVYRSIPKELPKHLYSHDVMMIQVEVESAYSEFLATDAGHSILISPVFSLVGLSEFSKKNEWAIYINGSYKNVIKLKFCDDRLCSVYRHRQYFDLP